MSPRPARGAVATGLAGAGLVLCALTVGAAPLLVPGLGLILIGLLAPLIAVTGARSVSVRRTLPAVRVQEDDPIELTLRVTRRRWDLARAEVFDPLHGPAPLPLPAGRPAGPVELRTVARLGPRGRVRLPPPSALVADPLGIVRLRSAGEPAEQEILVLPRVEPVRWLRPSDPGGEPAAEAGRPHAADPFGAGELDGLRPYRHGAPASRIHWATLARGAGLMERRLRPDGDGWPLVALDGRGAESDELLDAVIRAAASLVLALARRGGVRLALPGERRALPVTPELTAWPTVHARLALLDAEAARRAPPLTGASAAGLVMYVAARAPVRPLALRGVQTAVLVLPDAAAGPGGRPVVSVGECRGYELSGRLAGAA